MVLFCYICFGALINSLLIKLSFIDGLYFTLVSIETIGFGDIVPITTGSRVFICAYSAIGFLNLGVAIVMCRETVLELMEVEYKKRAQKVKERWKEAKEMRRIEHRWRHAIEWRLKEMGMPVWVRDENWHGHRVGGGGRSVKRVTTMDQNSAIGSSDPQTGHSHNLHRPTGMRLNLNALTQAQLEASAAEAGVPLNTLLPPDFIPAAEEIAVPDEDADKPSAASAWIHHPLASHFEQTFHPTQARTLTHARLGGMAALLTRFAVAVIHIHATEPDKPLDESAPSNQNGNLSSEAAVVGETPNHLQINPTPTIEVDSDSMPPHPTDNLDLQMMQDLDTMTFYTKLIIALGLFSVFWTVGAHFSLF
jgi:potassium channel subfamily K, other eukaryote